MSELVSDVLELIENADTIELIHILDAMESTLRYNEDCLIPVTLYDREKVIILKSFHDKYNLEQLQLIEQLILNHYGNKEEKG